MNTTDGIPFGLVMIIDDTKEDLYITNRIVSKANFTKKTLQFSSAEEALSYLKNNVDNLNAIPEVIFVDIHMPVMSGFDFLNAYESLPEPIKMKSKVYVISSTFDERDIENVHKDLNAKAFFEKPLTKENLILIASN